jgi:hypothetical protein
MKTSHATRCLLLTVFALVLAVPSFAGVFISVRIGPPPLPVYAQPPCPGDGYIWTPGYWAYGPDGYYWVPGTWVPAPEPGYLWTPGYWGWNEGFYVWHAGYWGPHVGFYGGINYGFGYFGSGYEGGYWRDRRFYYNRTVNNINITNVRVYNRTVINNVTVNRVSYNGGHGGINARPTRYEETAYRDHHFEPTHEQLEHEQGARSHREFWASENHGRPAMAATSRPGEFDRHHDERNDAGQNNLRRSEDRRYEDRRSENRRHENARSTYRPEENRSAPRPDKYSRNDGHANARQEAYGNRGDRPSQNGPGSEMRGHQQPVPHGNGNPPRPEAPRRENAPRGNGGNGHGDRR